MKDVDTGAVGDDDIDNVDENSADNEESLISFLLSCSTLKPQ